MLTIHRPLADDSRSVAVDGGRVLAVGPYAELHAAHGDRARVREWDGTLEPGRYEPDAVRLLETLYWPDPREADDLGTEPLPAASVPMTDTRWGASARRGVQRMLGRGVTAVAGPFARPAVRTAVQRSGVLVGPAPSALAPDARADFTVLAVDGSCLATVVGGRLVYRRA
ncbi:imidazolonepropionase-like domain-containing protein [Streptomyces sp. 2-6]|uniref:imidazolonepropionase-like domain-containing protein n=1 Tax=Streptomyces sp. 2-6 TaxID=2978333 RepID=UPI003D137590